MHRSFTLSRILRVVYFFVNGSVHNWINSTASHLYIGVKKPIGVIPPAKKPQLCKKNKNKTVPMLIVYHQWAGEKKNI
jgi:hypothetical protein